MAAVFAAAVGAAGASGGVRSELVVETLMRLLAAETFPAASLAFTVRAKALFCARPAS